MTTIQRLEEAALDAHRFRTKALTFGSRREATRRDQMAPFRLPDTIEAIERGRIRQQQLFDRSAEAI